MYIYIYIYIYMYIYIYIYSLTFGFSVAGVGLVLQRPPPLTTGREMMIRLETLIELKFLNSSFSSFSSSCN